jgi:hypothetical protein
VAVAINPHFSMEFVHRVSGVDFDERYYRDSEHRHAADIRVHAALHDFCERWWPEVAPGFAAEPRWTVGVGQAYIIVSALFGSSVRYAADFHPDCSPAPLAGVAHAAEVPMPDVESAWPLVEYVAEYKRLAAIHGRDRVSLPVFSSQSLFTPSLHGLSMHSPLTTAYRLRGDQLFIDMVERPALARRIFDAVRDTAFALFDLMVPLLGLQTDLVFYAACCSGFVSGAMWRDWELPAMIEIARRYGASIAIHSCGRSTQVLPAVAAVPALIEVHLGDQTDLGLVRRLLPGKGLLVIPDSVSMARGTPGDAAELVRGIMDRAGPGPLAVNMAVEAGIDPGVITAVRDTVRLFNDQHP